MNIFTCKLYESNGTTLVYDFDKVLDWGDGFLLDPHTFTKHQSLRGQGSIISEGSQTDWELPLEIYVSGDGYEELIALLKDLRDTIEFNHKYILKIGLDSIGNTEDLKVKRLTSISLPIDNKNSKVVRSQRPVVLFTVNCWS